MIRTASRIAALLVRVLLLTMLAACGLPVRAQAAGAPSRGELLYSTHCIECHNAQMHWRERKQARDWKSLKEQVNRWQQAARLGWDESDVDAVSHYLNRTIYRFPAPAERVGLK